MNEDEDKELALDDMLALHPRASAGKTLWTDETVLKVKAKDRTRKTFSLGEEVVVVETVVVRKTVKVTTVRRAGTYERNMHEFTKKDDNEHD